MTKPEKRWQLLLMADDGRIVPFKHIKGMALSLLVALAIMGLACAGLGWLLSKERIQHRQATEQLLAAKRDVARYKNEIEIVTAELILAEARMEKAGLPVPERKMAIAKNDTGPAGSDLWPSAVKREDEQEQKKIAPESQSGPVQVKEQPDRSLTAAVPNGAVSDQASNEPAAEADPPTIALGELELNHTPGDGRVAASLRVSNTGLRSSPVEGWCLMALKRDPADANTWVGLPEGALMNGKLAPKRGKNFKISRYIDMDMDTAVGADPSSFTTATVYIFDDAGSILMEKDFSISLKSGNNGADAPAEASIGGDAEEALVALTDFEIQHDTTNKRLRTMFRISNTGPRSSPVAGRCVVVLKNAEGRPDTWLTLPDGALIDGRPRREQGQSFKISRYKNMEIEVAVKRDPSEFDRAVVYIYGLDGGLLLEASYPIRLEAPVP